MKGLIQVQTFICWLVYCTPYVVCHLGVVVEL